jgi:hypothetical protein
MESDQLPYLFLRTLAMICCPRGDISVELAGDTGIRVPPAEYQSATVRDFFGVLGAKPSEWKISHEGHQNTPHHNPRTLQSFSWDSYADSALRWKGICDLPLATSSPKSRAGSGDVINALFASAYDDLRRISRDGMAVNGL